MIICYVLISKYILQSKKWDNISNMIWPNVIGANIETHKPISLFKYYIWSILEYSSVVYKPYHKYLIDIIEKCRGIFQRNYMVYDFFAAFECV